MSEENRFVKVRSRVIVYQSEYPPLEELDALVEQMRKEQNDSEVAMESHANRTSFAPLARVSEVAELLGVSRKALYRWIREGRLAACVVRLPSGHLRIDLDLLHEELQSWALLHADRRGRKSPSAPEGSSGP